MLALRYAAVVALTLWVGGLLVLGGIAAPSVFDVLATRQIADGRLIAGAIFGEALRRFHLLAYACGLVLLATLMMRSVLGPRPLLFAVRLAIAFVMVIATAYSGLILAPRIARIQSAAGGTPSALPENDMRRIAFGRLHAMSTGIQLVPILGGLFLLFRELKD